MKIELAKNEIIHFVGIGGIGMSGLSLIMKGKGFKVQGSDVSNNKNIAQLETMSNDFKYNSKITGIKNIIFINIDQINLNDLEQIYM